MTSPRGPVPRDAIPAGTVSTIRGRYQAPGLIWLARVVMVAGLVGAVLPGAAGTAVATAAVAAVVAAPLLRVAWLVFRWIQERDRRFVVIALALLGVIAAGAVLSALGVGN
jgi:Kef-type K+ transport system membrane component KefB